MVMIRTCKLWMLMPLMPLLTGCGGDGYPDRLRYPSRSDPIIKSLDLPRDDKGGVSQRIPDQPGVFPVMTMVQLREPSYPLNIVAGKALNPVDLSAKDRADLTNVLEQVFGTPANPQVDVPKDAKGNPQEGWEEVAETVSQAQQVLKLDAQTLQAGSKLYRVHCLHCHGLPGDGRGPTSFWINPHPRDYRLGYYKFTSTGSQIPKHGDLVRTLRVGIEGTAMPAFNLLPESDLQAMASYVIHLGLRGQVELQMMTGILSNTQEDFGEDIKRTVRGFTMQWLAAQKKALDVPEYPYSEKDLKESVQRGFTYWRDWQCYVCHIDYGRTPSFSYDFWGTLTRPANLTTGFYRGGRRPVDLYWRVLGGVHGAGMPANDNRAGPNPKVQAKNDQIWDMVNFLHALPYRPMRQEFGLAID